MTFSPCYKIVSRNNSIASFLSGLFALRSFVFAFHIAAWQILLFFRVSIYVSALNFPFTFAGDKVKTKTKIPAVLFYIFIKDLMMQHFRFNMLSSISLTILFLRLSVCNFLPYSSICFFLQVS